MKIKNEKELKEYISVLYDEGFGYINEYEFHNKKIDHIIRKENKLNIELKGSELKDLIKNEKDYEKIHTICRNYFSKFNSDDKIFELANRFSLIENDSVSAPYSSPSFSEIKKYVDFREKYGCPELHPVTRIYYYDLDKNILKLRFGEYFDRYKFETLYELVYNKKALEFSNKISDYQNIGEIDIKLYSNGNADFKGNLKPLKDKYYSYFKTKVNHNYILIYNKEKTINIDKNNNW